MEDAGSKGVVRRCGRKWDGRTGAGLEDVRECSGDEF